MGLTETIITGVIASLIASLLVAIITFLRVFKPFTDAALKEMRRITNPVDQFNDASGFLELLSKSLSTFGGDYRRLVLYRALPCEMSNAFLSYAFDGKTPDDTSAALNMYTECIRNIVREGVGAHDKSIFGRTGIESLDAMSRDIINSDYFAGDKAPDTTELGLHENFNEIGIVLIGVSLDSKSDDVTEWMSGFIMVFSEDFRRMYGFRHNVHQHIANLEIIYRQRQDDCERRGCYLTTSHDMASEIVRGFKAEVSHFFAGKVGCGFNRAQVAAVGISEQTATMSETVSGDAVANDPATANSTEAAVNSETSQQSA